MNHYKHYVILLRKYRLRTGTNFDTQYQASDIICCPTVNNDFENILNAKSFKSI